MSEAQRQLSTHTPAPPFTPARGSILQRACACGQHSGNGGECAACRQKRLGLQRQATSQTAPDVAPPIVYDVLRAPGQPLDTATRAFMEPRFGHDFSHVRVHTDAQAIESARAVNALAYTVGRDVVFGAGQYAPGTSTGQQLMTHELAHVVQQGKDAKHESGFDDHAALRIGAANDMLEREADAATMISGNISPPSPAARYLLQRTPLDSDEPRDISSRGTLPYREATELAECIRIMGEENRAYCRQEVLGEQSEPTLELDRAKTSAPSARPAKKPRPSAKPAKKASTKGVARQGECGEKCGGGELGSVECELNLETGMPTDKVSKEIREKDPCIRPCVDAHETVHVKDIEPICKRVHKCLGEAAGDRKKEDKCLDTYQAESYAKIAGAAGTECLAYKAEEQCMKKREAEPECKTKAGRARWTAHVARTKCYQDCYCRK
jgi:hypothetical protein